MHGSDGMPLRLSLRKTVLGALVEDLADGAVCICYSYLVLSTGHLLERAQVTLEHLANVGKHPTLDGDDPRRDPTWVRAPG